MKNKIIFLLVVLWTCSCNDQTHQNENLDYRILKKIEIELSSKNQYIHSQLQFLDSCTIIALDRNFRKLDIISICDERFEKSILLQDDGPDKVYPVSSFFYHSVDSIFLFSLDAVTFQLVDTSSHVLNEWRLQNLVFPDEVFANISGSNGYFDPFSLTQNGMFHLPFNFDESKNRLTVNILPQSEFMGFKDRKTYYSSPLIGIYSLENNSFMSFSGEWPDLYQADKTPNNPFNNFVFNDKQKFVINFYNSDKVFSSEKNDFYRISSNYFDERYTLFSIDAEADYTTEQELNAFHKDEGYVNLVFDPFKRLYYRIAKHSNDNLGKENSHRMEAEWSIIVFNENFVVLGEVLMPKKTYNYLQILPTNSGLLVSKENIYSPTNNEELYEFDLIEITL
ncbi:DUF4221 family protein [Marivirga arenosa]|uniref:DUF4221 family protein n=1 Tax=Marivirga arenosa TaxID=3059076 RepID=A0AA51N6X7_9BACT|nr:DUF4221 family protein [Marivirga sp. ABR2-2]WMN07262.1 DUF4221 family protein [Marivirga sp. ABR2-2]